jgi:hypothetical protein
MGFESQKQSGVSDLSFLGKIAEKADLRAGRMYVQLLQNHVPEMNPRLEQVNCAHWDKNGPMTHWGVTLTNEAGVDYYFSRCMNFWRLQLNPHELPRKVIPVDSSNPQTDCVHLVVIASNELEDKFTIS